MRSQREKFWRTNFKLVGDIMETSGAIPCVFPVRAGRCLRISDGKQRKWKSLGIPNALHMDEKSPTQNQSLTESTVRCCLH